MVKKYIIFRRGNIILHVSRKALCVWRKNRQLKSNASEKFGVIIGSQIDGDINKEYYIDLVTTPFSKDVSSRYRFLLQDKKHQMIVDKAYNESGGTSIYMGTWHTHPEEIPTPSGVDTRDWLKCIKRNSDTQLFFFIVGTREIRAYMKTSFLRFSKLKKGINRFEK